VTDPREMAFRDVRREDPARFLRELRELRNDAGLGHAELAARAHYPCDAIKAAEVGPALPDLPVLSAYVRGCGATLAEWEDRWRAITGCAASPLLAARETGCSEAADAGARVGAVSAFSAFSAVSADSDEQDTDRVMAALHRVADGRVADGRVADGSAAAAPVASALSDLAEYVAPGPAREATYPAKVAADVWTPARTTADSDLTAAPSATAESELAAAPSVTADSAPAAAPSATADSELAAAPSVTADSAPAARRSRGLAGSRKALVAAAVAVLLLVVILVAVFG
jgi:hypothetical protein